MKYAKGVSSYSMDYHQKTTGVCYVCVWATDGKDRGSETVVLHCRHIEDTEPVEEETVGKCRPCGWGTRQREGLYVVEPVAGNGFQ